MSASNAIITSPATFFTKHFGEKRLAAEQRDEEGFQVESYFGLKAPGAEDKWRMKTPFGTSDGSFKKFWSLVKTGKLEWDEDTDKIFDDASLKLLAEECGWATLRLEDCPEVSCFHLGFHYAHEGLKKRKVIKKTAKDEHTDDSTFQATGRLIGVGNKCCAVLHSAPDDQTNPTKSFVNAFGKGRGIIKKWVYSESVIRPKVIQRDAFIDTYKTDDEVLGGLDILMATKVSDETDEREAEEKYKKVIQASKLSEEDKLFIVGGDRMAKIMAKAKAKAEAEALLYREQKEAEALDAALLSSLEATKPIMVKVKRKSYKTKKAELEKMVAEFYEIDDKVVGANAYQKIDNFVDRLLESKACERNEDKREAIEVIHTNFMTAAIGLGYEFESGEESE